MNTVSGDLLAGPPDGLVSLHSVLGAWRRARRLIAALAIAGIVVGLLFAFAVPHGRSATTSLLLQYPSGVDASQAVQTDLSLLETRAVASVAEKSLGLDEPAATFASSYHGTVLSNAVLEITARASSATEAVRRANALARAFLQFRKQTYNYQLNVVQNVLHGREQALETELAATNHEISAVDATPDQPPAPGTPTLTDLLTQRTAQMNSIDQIESESESNVLATTTVVVGSHVIDAAAPVAISVRKTLLADVATGLVAALALALGGVTLVAVVSTRPVRRADIAAALEAPVLVSVGWLWRAPWHRTKRDAGPDDMTLVVRHLVGLLKSATTEPPALVVVAVGRLGVAAAAVDALARRLAEDGFELTVVNETGRPLARATTEPDSAADDDPHRDGVVVLASLAPARGAEHLREWASDAVVIVVSGRASTATLRSHATMIRSAGLKLRSVVVVGSDPHDDSLGAFMAPVSDDFDTDRVPASRRPTNAPAS
jgi:capsular polysaccharide biosynthesis protein